MSQINLKISGALAWLERTLAVIRGKSAKLRPIALCLAMAILVGGLAVAMVRHPDILASTELAPLALLLAIGTPATIAILCIEFMLMCRIAGNSVSAWQAAEVSVYSSAANYLPFPGSTATRMAVLCARGTSLRRAGLIILLFAGIWGTLAFCYAGIWLLVLGNWIIGSFGLSAGLLGAAVTVGLAFTVRPQPGVFLLAVVARLLALMVDALRISLAFEALGNSVSYGQASVFTIAGFLGSSMSIMPAGLGFREAIVAALAPIMKIDPAIGFVAAFINTLSGLFALVLLALVLFVARRGTSGRRVAGQG
ncbi:MAG: hypothetical protein MI806_08975 [Minwuiales bacterium]|nr:hypothetical protein [Minwuiales bacterium]